MWRKTEQKILQISRATGIEVVFHSDVDIKIHVYALKIEKNNPVKIVKHSNLKTFDELEVVPINLPVHIVFSGKGILVKKTTENINDDNVLSVLLPGANPTEFYTEVNKFEELSVIAIARKTLIDNCLNELERKNFKVLNFSLGFSVIENFLPFFDLSENQAIQTSSYILFLNQKKLVNIEPKDLFTGNMPIADEYRIGQTYLQPSDIIAYCASTNLLADDLKTQVSKSDLIQKNREEYRSGKYLKTFSLSLLVFVFAILLTNFFLYNHYFTANKEFEEQQSLTQSLIATESQLKNNLSKKEQFFEKNGWMHPAKTSFYADRFASFLPEGVWITNLNFYPLSLSESLSMNFKKDTILLNGICDDPYQINLLINNIKTLKEVDEVNMKEYSFKKEASRGEFTLEIKTK